MAKFELRKTDEEALKARLKLVGKEGETFKQGIRAKLALLSNKTFAQPASIALYSFFKKSIITQTPELARH